MNLQQILNAEVLTKHFNQFRGFFTLILLSLSVLSVQKNADRKRCGDSMFGFRSINYIALWYEL